MWARNAGHGTVRRRDEKKRSERISLPLLGNDEKKQPIGNYTGE